MQRTYKITKSSRGAYVQWGRPMVLGTDYAADGAYESGNFISSTDGDEVTAAVLRVIATGIPETLVLGEANAPRPQVAPNARLLACGLWTQDQGCVLHGELCREERERNAGSLARALPED